MKFKMTIFIVLVLVITGCGVKAEKQSNKNVIAITADSNLSNPDKELGEAPPQPVIKVDGKALTVYQSSYCWNSKSKGTGKCVDYVAPNELLKDKLKEQVKANTQITYKFDVKKPTEISVTTFHNGSINQETLNGEYFQTPQETGIYYYSLSALWLKDKEKRISEGSSDYTFAIEVT